MQEFKINRFITLKLENDRTLIYIAGKRFEQCKRLLLNIPVENGKSSVEIESIDEAAEKLGYSRKKVGENSIKISPETEFWAHCSNLQAWDEHDYDTRLLRSNLAFPLLKKLTEEGDLLARRVFREEIAKRLESNHLPTIQYLVNEGYLSYLNKDELDNIMRNLIQLGKIEQYLYLEEKSWSKFNCKFQEFFSREQFWSYLPKEAQILREIENRVNGRFILYSEDEDYLFNHYEKKKQLGFSLKGDDVDCVVFYNCKEFELNLWKEILEALGGLKNLKVLGIEYCNLKRIPESIGHIHTLNMLLLGGNDLDNLPDSIKNLKNLRLIELDKKIKKKLSLNIQSLKKKGVRIN